MKSFYTVKSKFGMWRQPDVRQNKQPLHSSVVPVLSRIARLTSASSWMYAMRQFWRCKGVQSTALTLVQCSAVFSQQCFTSIHVYIQLAVWSLAPYGKEAMNVHVSWPTCCRGEWQMKDGGTSSAAHLQTRLPTVHCLRTSLSQWFAAMEAVIALVIAPDAKAFEQGGVWRPCDPTHW